MKPRALLILLALGTATAQDEKPARSTLTERTGRTLVQLEVLVDGPPGRIGALAAEDFVLTVGGKEIEELAVDPFCDVRPDAAGKERTTEPESLLASPPLPTYLFYFDQTMMTIPGRVRALQVARKLIDDLFEQPARGLIVSSGMKVETHAGPTGDPEQLRIGLERLRTDIGQWDTFASGEPSRIEEVAERFGSGGCAAAEPLANAYYKDEIRLARRSVDRMSAVIGSLLEVAPPKIVLYFADTLRALPGRHYWEMIPCNSPPDYDDYHLSTPLERLYAVASTASARLYPVRAQGLAYPAQQAVGPLAIHLRDAENTLEAIGLETGGDAFTGATSPKNMIERLRRDLSCRYLLSFDAAGLPPDRKLAVYLDTVPLGVRARTRPSLVVQSERERRVARLTAAFVSGLSTDLPDVRIETMPLGFAEGSRKKTSRMKTIVQARLPAPEIAISAWEVGLSIVRKNRVVHEVSGSLEGVPVGAPIVVETVVELPGGSHEIVGVASESLTDRVLSSRTEEDVVGTLEEPLSLFPLEVYQESSGLFWRDGRVLERGNVLLGSDAVAEADRPLTVAGLVCRGGKKGARVYTARRTAHGPEGARYPHELPIDLTRERCVLVRNALPAAWVGAGDYSFRLEILDGERVLATRTTTFRAEDL